MGDDVLPPALTGLLDQVNGKRRKLLLTRDDVAQAIDEAMTSEVGIAVRHGGAELLAKTSLCLAVKPPKRHGVVVGLALTYADRPTPGRAWKELQPWQQDFAKNAAKAYAWADADKPDRVFVGAAKAKASKAKTTAKGAAQPAEAGKLLAEILAHPDDDQARLVYADFLTQNGDPRGELITVQLSLPDAKGARKSQLAAREKELIKKHGRTWAKEAMQDAKEHEIRRGFVALVKMTGTTWGTKGARLFACDPIEELLISKPNAAGLKAIAAAPHTARLRVLANSSPIWLQSAKDVTAFTELLKSKHVGAVHDLRFSVDHDSYLAPVPDLAALFDGVELAGTRRFQIAFGSSLAKGYDALAKLKAPALEELVIGSRSKPVIDALKKIWGKKLRTF